jgi:ABC-2 type transport system permease protein
MNAAGQQAAWWLSARRLYAMVLRYWYVLRGSWPRLVEIAYWPTVQMVLWGFTAHFIGSQTSNAAKAAGLFLGAVLLWDILFRSQLGVTLVCLEELYARNLPQLFMTPLRPWEYVGGLLLISLLRTLFGVGVAVTLAWVFFDYGLWTMGLQVIAFFVLLVSFGWALGIAMTAMLLRFGLGVEGIAWGGMFLLAPFSGVYYPISTLPALLRPIAWLLPSSHVFEGMRAAIWHHTLAVDHLLIASGQCLLYLVLAWVLFHRLFVQVRHRGTLLSQGE